MTIRNAIAAAAVSTIALIAGTAGAADFTSQLNEAKLASLSAGRDVREAVTPALNAAQAQGSQDQLDFARRTLGLSVESPVVATPVVAPAVGSLDQQIGEAKLASLTAGRDVREAVAPAINAAVALNAQGNDAAAQDHLNYARGQLGLPVVAQADSNGLAGTYTPPSAR